MDDLVRLLADLVSIPSCNPMGRSRSRPGDGEERLAAHVAGILSDNGIDTQMQTVAPGRPNVLASIDVGAERTLLLEAHLDTVQGDGMTIAPFEPVVRDGKLYGRGSCDTKGSLAMFLHALTSLKREGRRMSRNVVFLAVADEEYHFTGATHAVQCGLRADAGIIGEPTCLRIVHAHKGVTRWRIHAHGRAGHSAYPDRGDNAIYRMAAMLNRLEDYATILWSEPPHPLLGPPSISVGVIEGGTAVNIIPDHCWVEVDRRTLPGETSQDVLEPVRRLLREIPAWSMDEPHLSVGGLQTPVDAPVVRMLHDAIAAEGVQPALETAQYATDAGTYATAGIPCVVFGPGDIAQAHTATEYIDIEQLALGARIIRRLLTT